MRKWFLSVWAIIFLGTALNAAPLELGATRVEAYRVLGAPDGMLELPNKTVLMYETAELTFVNDVLTEAVWRSEEEVAAEKALQAKLRADWEREQALDAERRLQRGKEILAARLANPGFQNLPAAQRLGAWTDFMRDYPGVDATAEYEAALAEVRAEAKVRQAEQQQVAQAASDRSWSQTSLIDTVEVGGNWGYGYGYPTGPSVAVGNNAVVVVGGNSGYPYGYCPPVQRRPILSVSYRSDDFGVRFTSGGGYSPLRRDPYVVPRQPVVIVTGQ